MYCCQVSVCTSQLDTSFDAGQMLPGDRAIIQTNFFFKKKFQQSAKNASC